MFQNTGYFRHTPHLSFVPEKSMCYIYTRPTKQLQILRLLPYLLHCVWSSSEEKSQSSCPLISCSSTFQNTARDWRCDTFVSNRSWLLIQCLEIPAGELTNTWKWSTNVWVSSKHQCSMPYSLFWRICPGFLASCVMHVPLHGKRDTQCSCQVNQKLHDKHEQQQNTLASICSFADPAATVWWKVDLGHEFEVYEVVVFGGGNPGKAGFYWKGMTNLGCWNISVNYLKTWHKPEQSIPSVCKKPNDIHVQTKWNQKTHFSCTLCGHVSSLKSQMRLCAWFFFVSCLTDEFSKIQVLVTNQTNPQSDGDLCDDVVTGSSGQLTVKCTVPTRGQFVVIRNTGDERQNGLILRKVEVNSCRRGFYGYKQPGQSDCSLRCAEGCEPFGICRVSDGFCSKCKEGRWGENCDKLCHCASDIGLSTCSRSNGSCGSLRCQMGWWGDRCDSPCNCAETRACIRGNGTCGLAGCATGFARVGDGNCVKGEILAAKQFSLAFKKNSRGFFYLKAGCCLHSVLHLFGHFVSICSSLSRSSCWDSCDCLGVGSCPHAAFLHRRSHHFGSYLHKVSCLPPEHWKVILLGRNFEWFDTEKQEQI